MARYWPAGFWSDASRRLCSHLPQTRLVNKGFIIYGINKAMFLSERAGKTSA